MTSDGTTIELRTVHAERDKSGKIEPCVPHVEMIVARDDHRVTVKMTPTQAAETAANLANCAVRLIKDGVL